MFCQHCGKPMAEKSVFCNHCGGRQGTGDAAAPGVGTGALLEKVFTNIPEVAEDPHWADLPPGRVVHLHPTIESGGPYGLLVADSDSEVLLAVENVMSGATYDVVAPADGAIGIAFYCEGKSGIVRLRVD